MVDVGVVAKIFDKNLPSDYGESAMNKKPMKFRNGPQHTNNVQAANIFKMQTQLKRTYIRRVNERDLHTGSKETSYSSGYPKHHGN